MANKHKSSPKKSAKPLVTPRLRALLTILAVLIVIQAVVLYQGQPPKRINDEVAKINRATK